MGGGKGGNTKLNLALAGLVLSGFSWVALGFGEVQVRCRAKPSSPRFGFSFVAMGLDGAKPGETEGPPLKFGL